MAQSRLELLSWVPMECRDPLDSGPLMPVSSSSSITSFSATTYSPGHAENELGLLAIN
jgi:hypothetical protein